MLPRAWTTWTWLHVEVSSSFGCRPGYRLPCNRKWEKLSASIVLSPLLLVAVAYIPVVRTALFSLCPSSFPFFIFLLCISSCSPWHLLVFLPCSRFFPSRSFLVDSIKLILYHFAISFFLPSCSRFLSPCCLTPVYLFNSFTLVLRLHIFPRQFLFPDDPRNLFSYSIWFIPCSSTSMFFDVLPSLVLPIPI